MISCQKTKTVDNCASEDDWCATDAASQHGGADAHDHTEHVAIDKKMNCASQCCISRDVRFALIGRSSPKVR
jgi:hypothetical protein